MAAKDPFAIAPEPVKGDSLTQFLRSLTNIGALRSEELYKGGQATLARGKETFEAPASYWGKILSGDRAAMMEAIAPEVSSIANQYRNVQQAVSRFAPRGGGRAAALTSAPYQMAGDIQSLLQRVRPEAAQQLTQIASLISNLGLGELGLSNQEMALVLQALLSRRGQNLQERAQNIQLGTGLGAGTGSLIGGLLMGGGSAGTAAGAAGAGTVSLAPYFESVGLRGAGAGGATAGGTGALLGTGAAGAAANVGVGAGGLGLAYLLAKIPAWGDWQEYANKQPSGTSTGVPGFYWVPTNRGMKMGRAQDYYNATGQWPEGYTA